MSLALEAVDWRGVVSVALAAHRRCGFFFVEVLRPECWPQKVVGDKGHRCLQQWQCSPVGN
eukprot:15483063-Alexandrium_andersonii.AAC.1